MDGLRRLDARRLTPAACGLLALAACTPARYAATGPQPAPCSDSIAARVARMPTESVTVAEREHALWAQVQCRLALDSASRAARETEPQPAAASGAAPSGAAAGTAWPPPACRDSVAARVARMSADSVSPADRERARAAREECEHALASPPPPAVNPASSHPMTAILIGALVVLVLAFAL